jgi:AraC-like DNA-binding protein
MSAALKDAVTQYMQAVGGEGLFPTAVDGLVMMRTSNETLPHHMIYKPALCIVVQGAKQLMLGDQVFNYEEMQSLVVSVELPAFGFVTRASADKPYLGITLEFDVAVMREVMEQLDMPSKPGGRAGLGVFVDHLDSPLSECIGRLIRMLDMPKAIPILYPSIMREICFWLLTGANGAEIAKLALPDGHTQRITEAIYLLRDDFARPIRIEQLAAAARMSPSSFHQHFRALTSMTPLQYQKHLRLLEARRLMVAGRANVMRAAYQVGYESTSQFSREYARMFGVPPRRDAAGIKSKYQPDVQTSPPSTPVLTTAS